jgi:hypothetical protein
MATLERIAELQLTLSNPASSEGWYGAVEIIESDFDFDRRTSNYERDLCNG